MKIESCCLCGKLFTGYGNNPWPLASNGCRCCDECNLNKVVPARIRLMNQKDKETKEEISEY